MKVFGLLERAQAEPLASDPTGAGLIVGRFFYHSGTDSFKYYGVSMRTVVNTDQAQTLDNKSLTTALFPHQTTPSNPASGNIKVYSKNDDKLYVLDENGNETSVGSGGGGSLNFYEKGDADLAQVGEFSQGSDPTFGNGGASSSTFALTATNPARGTKSFEMTLNGTPSASNNDYVRSELIPIPLGYRGQFLTVVAKYNYDGLDDDIKLVVRDETNSVLITDTTEKFKKYVNADGYTEISFVVYVAQSCANLSVGPQVVSHATGNEVLKWDDVIVTPDLSRSKEVVKITPWEDWTPTGSWTSSALYYGKKRRVGDTMELEISIHMNGTPNAANLEVNLPDGIVIDGSKQWAVNVRKGYGSVQIRDQSTGSHYTGTVRGVDGTTVSARWQGSAQSDTPVDHLSPVTINSDDSIVMNLQFPVLGWEVYEENILTTANVGDVGSIQAFGSTTTPDGFLYCDGSSLLRSQYADLFASIGTAYGTADGDHFNLPDFRGNFMRGYDGVGADPGAASRVASKPGGNTGDNIGSYQSDAFQGHWHQVGVNSSGALGNAGVSGKDGGVQGSPNRAQAPVTDGVNGTPRISSETRPVNVSVRYYVRYRSSVSLAALPKVYAGIVGDVRTSMLTEASFQTYAGEGWVLLDGRSVVGSAYEAITGNTNIPDARGRALRMKDNAAGVNPDGDLALGANQADAFASHTHGIVSNQVGALAAGSPVGVNGANSNLGITQAAEAVGGNETRMKNTTVNFFVKIN